MASKVETLGIRTVRRSGLAGIGGAVKRRAVRLYRWAQKGQIGPNHSKDLGRHLGARC
jgi:hypothetical protein